MTAKGFEPVTAPCQGEKYISNLHVSPWQIAVAMGGGGVTVSNPAVVIIAFKLLI